MFAQIVLVFGLLDLVQVVEEEHGVFSAIVSPGEDVSGNARRTTILDILIAEENVNTAVFESNGILQALLLLQAIN